MQSSNNSTPIEAWQNRAQALHKRADKVSAQIIERARKACKDAGLDPTLLGIHPHNAMCGLEHGKPWPGIDYSLVRRSLWLQRKAWEPSRIVRRIIDRDWKRSVAR